MAWKRLTVEDLKLVLSQDEIDKLENMSVDMENIINAQIDAVANLFRGAWKSKGYIVDVRDCYVAPSYVIPILNYARYQIWTRFPMTENYSLSEPRQKGYDEAVELLKNPYIGVEDPADKNDPDNPNNKVKQIDSAISIPYLRMDDPYIGFSYNFQNKFNETI